MLVHKTKTRSRSISGFSQPTFFLFALIAFILLVIAFLLPRLYTNEPTISDPAQRPFANFRDEKGRFSISYPLDWQVLPGNEGTGVLTIASTINKKGLEEGGQFSTGSFRATATPATNFAKIDVLTFEVEPGTTARDFLVSRSSLPPSGNVQNTKVGNYDAVRVDVETIDTIRNIDPVKSYSSVFFTVGNRGFIIAGSADEATFNRILQSFRTW